MTKLYVACTVVYLHRESVVLQGKVLHLDPNLAQIMAVSDDKGKHTQTHTHTHNLSRIKSMQLTVDISCAYFQALA